MKPVNWYVIGFIWAYNVVVFAGQEVCKMGVYWALERYSTLAAGAEHNVAQQFLTDTFLKFSTGEHRRNSKFR